MSSKFFQSELVRGDIQEMATLQEFCFRSAANLALLSNEAKHEYFEALELLLEKQKIFHTRLSLSDDPDAKQMKEQITQSAAMMGLPKGADINNVFNDMSKAVSLMKDQIDNI